VEVGGFNRLENNEDKPKRVFEIFRVGWWCIPDREGGRNSDVEYEESSGFGKDR
jgi:hypothetical protein